MGAQRFARVEIHIGVLKKARVGHKKMQIFLCMLVAQKQRCKPSKPIIPLKPQIIVSLWHTCRRG